MSLTIASYITEDQLYTNLCGQAVYAMWVQSEPAAPVTTGGNTRLWLVSAPHTQLSLARFSCSCARCSYTRPLLKVPSSDGSEQRAQEQENLANESWVWGALTNHRRVFPPVVTGAAGSDQTQIAFQLNTPHEHIIDGPRLTCPMRALGCHDQPIRGQKS